MTKARSELVAVAETPFYHCISRCVRRAFLCGYDAVTGRNLSHRRDWVVRRMRVLSKVFTIDVCAFAIMGNHYHLVLRIDSMQAQSLSFREVAIRWRRLFKGDMAVQRFLDGSELDEAEQQRVRATVGAWRSRLASLSWYMRALNEHIARRANAEDACKGRFWEGRFKSQALLDDQALLSCMAYVDLNPIRAQMASTPETSVFTSISQRIRDIRSSLMPSSSGTRHARRVKTRQTACPLMPFASDGGGHDALPFDGREYMELVDWSGRILRPDKHGSIPSGLPPILLRLGIDRIAFARHVASNSRFARAVGTVEQLRAFAKKCGQCFTKGVGAAKALFGSGSLQPG